MILDTNRLTRVDCTVLLFTASGRSGGREGGREGGRVRVCVCVCVCVVYILTSDDECEVHSFIANGIDSETLVQCIY